MEMIRYTCSIFVQMLGVVMKMISYTCSIFIQMPAKRKHCWRVGMYTVSKVSDHIGIIKTDTGIGTSI